MATAVTTNVKNSLTSKKQTFSAFLTGDAIKQKVNQMVAGKDGERFITALISAVSTNPALAECEHTTILSAAMVGEALKLSPSPQLGQYYLVPFKNKKRSEAEGREVKEAQFQIGYKGYIQLAKRSGQYKRINVVAIKKGELVKYDPLEEEIIVNLIQDDIERENTETIGYYAMIEEIGGFRKSLYWSKEKMQIHADKYSMAYSLKKHQDLLAGKVSEKDMWRYSSFWYKDFDAMAFKTMLRQLISKWGTMSIELQTAALNDMAVINDSGQISYVENSDFEETPMIEAQPQEEPEEQIIEAKISEPKQQKVVQEENPFENRGQA